MIKTKLLKLTLAFIIVANPLLFAAAYNLPSHLINVPIYKPFTKGEIISGVSVGMTTSQNYLTEFDLNVYYAVTNRFIAGLNLANRKNVVINLHYNFLGTPSSKYKIAGGLTNIPINGDLTVSSLKDLDIKQENAYSPYLVGTLDTGLLKCHLGYGGNQFQYANKSNAIISQLPGIIFGFEMPVNDVTFGIEFDGKDINIGSTTLINNRTEIFVSLTELFISGTTNPQYNNHPRRWFTFGIKHNFSKTSVKEDEQIEELLIVQNYQLKQDQIDKIINDVSKSYEDELEKWKVERNNLKNEIDNLKLTIKQDLAYIDEKDLEVKEIKRQQYLSNTQEIAEKVIAYYYESFELFANKEHYKAIQVLQKAMVLNPYLPHLYIRLGSIYYDLNLKEMAIIQWEKALELDPGNLKLQKFLEKL